MTYIDAIPPLIKQALDNHAEHGQPCGSFTTAVLENDFMRAIGHADEESFTALRAIAQYVHCNLPSPCHGSPETVRAWRERFSDPSLAEYSAELARSVREHG